MCILTKYLLFEEFYSFKKKFYMLIHVQNVFDVQNEFDSILKKKNIFYLCNFLQIQHLPLNM